MYAKVNRTDKQAVTEPEAVACGVIYVDPQTTVNEQRCVGKYLCVLHLHEQPAMHECTNKFLENLRKMTAQPLDLNNSTLFGLLEPLSSLWYQLGEALTLTPHLDQIKINNHNDEQRLKAVLQKWKQYQIKTYSWVTLVNALESNQVRALQLADELKAKVGSESSL